MTDQERHGLRDRLLKHYTSHVPDGIELKGRLSTNPNLLEFWVKHRVGAGAVYGGAFHISDEALDDGLDAQPGVEALLERARHSTLPRWSEQEAAPLLLLCTSELGLKTVE